jgi:uncharacterized protein (DUF58 family)
MPLLEPAVVRELDLMRRSIERRVASQAPGQQLSPRRGGQAEFVEHKNYGPGDDLRKVDWAAYARSGEPVLKVFRKEEDTLSRLLLDTSGSLGLATPSKLRASAQLAAALGYLSLVENERTQLVVSAGKTTRFLPTCRGRQQLVTWLRQLESLKAAGSTRLAQAIDELVKRRARSGNLVVLSDFFEDSDLLKSLSRARHAGHAIVLVQLLCEEEVNPSFEGDLQLVDCESEESIEFSSDAEALAAYHAAFRRHVDSLRTWARRHRAGYVQVVGPPDIGSVVRRILKRNIDP